MTLEKAIAWCMENCAEIGFGRNPRDGEKEISMRVRSRFLRDWDPAKSPAEQFLRLVERAAEDRRE